MKLRTITACLICLIVGLVAGRLLPRQVPPPSATGPSVDGGGGAQREAPLRTRPRAGGGSSQVAGAGESVLDAELTEAEGDGSLVMVPASLIGELSRTAGTRSLGQELFSRDGKIEEYLRITDQEKAAVQTAWKSSRQKIRDLEATSSKSEDLEDRSVKITVPDLTKGMGVLGEDFKSSVKDVLGGNRGEVFLEMKQVEKIIAPPAGERIYTLKVEPTGDGGWRYHTVFENAGERRVWVGASVPNEIRHLTDAAKIFPAVKQAGNEDGEGE